MKDKFPLLNVIMYKEDGKNPRVRWDVGKGANVYFLLGVLEYIKSDILKNMDEEDNVKIFKFWRGEE